MNINLKAQYQARIDAATVATSPLQLAILRVMGSKLNCDMSNLDTISTQVANTASASTTLNELSYMVKALSSSNNSNPITNVLLGDHIYLRPDIYGNRYDLGEQSFLRTGYLETDSTKYDASLVGSMLYDVDVKDHHVAPEPLQGGGRICFVDGKYACLAGDNFETLYWATSIHGPWTVNNNLTDQTSGITLHRMASGNGRFVVLDASGIIRIFQDVTTTAILAEANISFPTTNINIEFAGGFFFGFNTVGNSGTLYISADARSWSTVNLPTMTGAIYSVSANLTSNATEFVVSGSAGYLWTATATAGNTPTTFTRRTVNVGSAFGAAVKNTSTWVAVGANGQIYTSTNLSTWTARTSGTTETFIGVAWFQNAFLALTTTGKIFRSVDGTAGWTQYSTAHSGTTTLDAANCMNRLPIVNNDLIIHHPALVISSDGLAWRNVGLTTGRNTSSLSQLRPSEIFYDASLGKYYAELSTSNGATVKYVSSTDLVSWVHQPKTLDRLSVAGGRLFGHGSLAAVTAIRYSTDGGINWVDATGIFPPHYQTLSIFHAGGTNFVAVSTYTLGTNHVCTSVDGGATWSAQTIPTSFYPTAWVYDGTRAIVALVNTSTQDIAILTFNGSSSITVIPRINLTSGFTSIEHLNGVYIAVSSAKVYRSTNLVNWTEVSAYSGSGHRVFVVNNKFHISGKHSTDGLTWATNDVTFSSGTRSVNSKLFLQDTAFLKEMTIVPGVFSPTLPAVGLLEPYMRIK